MKILAAIILLLALAIVGLTQQPAAIAPKTEAPAVIPAPVEKRLTWENHRLRAANFRLLAEAEDRAAESVLAEMCTELGDKYAPHLNSETGLLDFVIKSSIPSSTQTAGATAAAAPSKKDKK